MKVTHNLYFTSKVPKTKHAHFDPKVPSLPWTPRPKSGSSGGHSVLQSSDQWKKQQDETRQEQQDAMSAYATYQLMKAYRKKNKSK